MNPPPNGWRPLLLVAVAALVLIVYALAKHPDLAMALVAVGTIGAAVAAAASARQSAATSRERSAAARRAEAYRHQPTLWLGQSPAHGMSRLLVAVTGHGDYDEVRWEPSVAPGHYKSLPIQRVSDASVIEEVPTFALLGGGLTTITFTVAERKSQSTWLYRLDGSTPGASIFYAAMPQTHPMDLVD